MPTVLIYGPDSLQARVYDRLGPSNVLGGAVLPGFALRFNKPNLKNKNEGLANLVEDPKASVFGVLYDLTRAQLDMLEGYYGGYTRRDVKVDLVSPVPEERPPPPADSAASAPARAAAPAPPKKLEAVVLLARRTAEKLKPARAAIDLTVKGARENGAPVEFITLLEKTEVLDG
jgi:hypothetical protein